jgi:subtilisin family serine protease
VSGSDKGARFWNGSFSGPGTIIAAPAVEIAAPVPTSVYPSGYEIPSGTSPAAAIVSGTVALIRSKYPSMDAANVINRLIKTAVAQGDLRRDDQFGYGTVEPYRALTSPVAPVTGNPLITPGQYGQPPAVTQSPPSNSSGQSMVPWLIGAVCLFVVVTVVVLLVLLSSSRRRKRLPPAPGVGPPLG